MALAVSDLERTLSAARTQVRVLRHETGGPSGAALLIAGLLIGGAILLAGVITRHRHEVGLDASHQALRELPEDDETPSEDENAEAAEAKAQLARGEGIPWSQLRDELKTG